MAAAAKALHNTQSLTTMVMIAIINVIEGKYDAIFLLLIVDFSLVFPLICASNFSFASLNATTAALHFLSLCLLFHLVHSSSERLLLVLFSHSIPTEFILSF